jgi:hypothetical protein
LISKRSFTRFLKSVNPVSWEPMLTDKGIFSRYCMQAGLPTPPLLALFFKHTRGWILAGRSPLMPREWEEFVVHDLPDRFVVKPSQGAYGEGVRIIARSGESLVQRGRGAILCRELIAELYADPVYDAFVIQQMLVNHPDVRGLSGAEGLQTCRVMTTIRPDGTPDVLYAFLRVIAGDSPIDNFRSGTAGNYLARINCGDGTIHSCWRYAREGGAVRVDSHPVTGIRFAGYQLPFWPEAMQLALRAALAFCPIRTVGWDIALTGTGPVLVEGNIWYDPVSHSGQMDRIIDRIVGRSGDGETMA